MEQNTSKEQANYLKLQCPECGAPIKATSSHGANCPSCGQTFLLDEADGLVIKVDVDCGNSKDTKKTINIILIILSFILVIAFIVLTAIFSFNYDAINSRFFSSDYDWFNPKANIAKMFCEDIFNKPYNEITEEEFASIRYIKYGNERISGTNEYIHIIEYSFNDYRDCENEASFLSTIKRWTCQQSSTHTSFERAMNFSMFTKLTRVALGGHQDSFTRNSFADSADIRYVTTYSEIADAEYIRKIVNPKKVEVLEYNAWTNLDGIESFPNLKTLNIKIWYGYDFDFTRIEHCQNLEELIVTDFADNYQGLSKIGEMKNLKKLSLENLYLHDCEFIRNLTNLEELTIQIDKENPKTEMLTNLQNLKTLYLLGNGYVPAKDIASFDTVTTLKLSVNSTESFEALTNLKKLKTLDVCAEIPCDTTKVTKHESILDISCLTKLSSLEYLYIQPKSDCYSDDTCVYGLEQILNCQNLKNVYINEQPPPFLPNIGEEVTLYIDISSFNTNKNLNQLQFVDCIFKDINTQNEISPEFIRCYPNLYYLTVDSCRIDQLSFLESLPNLRYCSFVQNEINDFTPLNKCKFLEVVALYDNVATVSGLSNEIIILTNNWDGVNLTEYLKGVKREVGYIKRQESEEDE